MRKVYILSMGMFALGIDAYIIAGVLPFLNNTFDSSYATLGQSVTIFTLFYALSGPLFSGLLVNKTTKQALLLSMIIFSIANLMTALSYNLTMLFFSRAMAGMGAGLYSPMSVSAASQLVDNHNKGKALGIILTGMSCGTVIGIPSGLYLSNFFPWQVIFYLIFTIGLLSLVLISFAIPDLCVCKIPNLITRMSLLKDRRIRKTITITFLMGLTSLGLYTYIAPLIQHNHSRYDVSLFLWAWGFGGIIGSLLIGRILDHFRRPAVTLFMIIFILMIAVILVPVNLKFQYVCFIPFIIWGAMGWSSQAPQQHRLLSLQHKHSSVVALALNSSANYIGSSVGAALGGLLLWAHFDINLLPLFASFVLLLALIIQYQIIGE